MTRGGFLDAGSSGDHPDEIRGLQLAQTSAPIPIGLDEARQASQPNGLQPPAGIHVALDPVRLDP